MTTQPPPARERPIPTKVRVRSQRPMMEIAPKLREERTRSRKIVAWLLSATIAVGSVAYAYRPWPCLWGMVAAVWVALIVWLPDVYARGSWRPTTTIVAAISGALVAYGTVACCNASFRYDDNFGRLVALSHVDWLPSAVDAGNALPTLCAIAAALAAMVMATDLGKSARLRQRLFAAIAIGGLVTAAIGVVEWLPGFNDFRAWDAASPWFEARPFGLLGYHNHAATLMNLAIPATAIVALHASQRGRVVASTVIAALVGAAIRNVSRTGLAIAGVEATCCTILLWSPSRRADRRRPLAPIFVTLLIAICAAIAVFAARPEVVSRMFATFGDDRFKGYFPRLLHWTAGRELFARSPVFGLGPGGYRMLAATTSTKGYYLGPPFVPGRPFTAALNAMNDYLQTFVEWGIVGATIWTILFMGAARNAWLALRKPAVARREVALVVLVAFAIFAHSLVDPPLQAPLFQLIAATLVGMLWSARRWRGRPGVAVAEFFESNAGGGSRGHV